ncbi:15597_t:CDS:2 [Dentiscutata erythropus]|uniref:15597_t:CDS:1 n=1 Tax=Dentiscutata erythropus TaxID=1348616 RepID=A0A9N8V9D4_9GLOM|nr:15597_t:CDS:2 [Dentiscutata erythropus]
MEPINETILPFQYYPLYPLFEEGLIDETILYGSEDNNIGYTSFDFSNMLFFSICNYLPCYVFWFFFCAIIEGRHPSFREDKAYPLGLKNTNTDAQPFFDSENENVIDSHEESVNIDHDDIDNNTEDELDVLKLFKDKPFDTWEIAESYLDQYGKQEGFFLRKRCRVADPKDNSITRCRTYECSHGCTHEADKTLKRDWVQQRTKTSKE